MLSNRKVLVYTELFVSVYRCVLGFVIVSSYEYIVWIRIKIQQQTCGFFFITNVQIFQQRPSRAIEILGLSHWPFVKAHLKQREKYINSKIGKKTNPQHLSSRINIIVVDWERNMYTCIL